jgi:hypothetical protein
VNEIQREIIACARFISLLFDTRVSSDPRRNPFDLIEWFSTLLREARSTLYSFSVGETNSDGRANNYLSLLGGVRSDQQTTFTHLN